MNNGTCCGCRKPTNEMNGTFKQGLSQTFWFCNNCTRAAEIEREIREAEEEKEMEIEMAWQIREEEKREAEKRARDYMAGVY